jgi:phosphoenolpyruvate carboxykinase (diphosphate)
MISELPTTVPAAGNPRTSTQPATKSLSDYIHVKLALLGLGSANGNGGAFGGILSSLVAQYREKERLLANHLCPADHRIQTFLYDYLQEYPVPKLPLRTFVLDAPGLARLLSLPEDGDEFVSSNLSSYRVRQGVLHNPRSDRRTTQGIFHISEGGLPIPADKKSVPLATAATILAHAFQPPAELMRLPFTLKNQQLAECFVSLLIRPLVCPAVPGFCSDKTMEIRFFAPGGLVSNLDFVETIFGNAGDPGLPENDAGLDTEKWSGHTGCVILAPHLTSLTKKAVGLPAWESATERQRRDGMCWKDESELYNDGQAFKLTCRDQTGIMVTVIADNYFGYCKKEVKTQISFAANLFGLCEEEHAGGAMVFPSYDLGEDFSGELHVKSLGHSYEEVVALHSASLDAKPEGYAVDKRFSDIIYVREDAHFDLHHQRVAWVNNGVERSIKLLPENTYVRPSGYSVRMEKPHQNRSWRLVGVVGEGALCHKPCTVSGGGKSEISKPISDAILTGPVFVADFKKDFDQVEQLIGRDYSKRFKDPSRVDTRLILSEQRSLGSVIKLLTPDERDYTPEYNEWLAQVPQHIRELVYVVKRYYKAEWGNGWRDHFGVDKVNGMAANELKCHNRKLLTTYLRVGFDADGSWRTFGLRKDFHPALKLQMEDDITASVIVPPGRLAHLPASCANASLRFVQNAEARLFQRPDDAIHPGYDKQTESDFTCADNFFSNYQPLEARDAVTMFEDSIEFYQYTEPMRNLIQAAATNGEFKYFVCSSRPRVVGGRPSKNPRYLQARQDLINPRESYLAEMSSRLFRRLRPGDAVLRPVTAVLPGRRNNPPEPGVRPLAVFNPIHYLELPELFMEFISSMTGKSPSTTGAGSEGALTKSPFNALPPIMDLNNALVSWLLTGHHGYVTAAGYVGPKFRVDHDISLLVPELWCRMSAAERDPAFLMRENFLEKCSNFDFEGRRVLAGRLGYRITARFVHAFLGRIFNHPYAIFSEEMLRPELQDMRVFVDGVDNIVSTQKRVAQLYFDDGSVHQACPPLKALLHVMLYDQWEGKDLAHPELRALFTREALLASDWYAARLKAKQKVDQALWSRHVDYLHRFLKKTSHADEAVRLGIRDRLEPARIAAKEVESPEYLEQLRGTLGAEPIERYLEV